MAVFFIVKKAKNTPVSYSEDTGKARDWYFEAQLNYNRTFGDHSVGALVLYNQSKNYYPSTYSDIPRGYVGLVGRVTYDYKSRYITGVQCRLQWFRKLPPRPPFRCVSGRLYRLGGQRGKLFQALEKSHPFLEVPCLMGFGR